MAVTAEGARRKERILCLFDVDGTLTPARQVGPQRPEGSSGHEYYSDVRGLVWDLQQWNRGHLGSATRGGGDPPPPIHSLQADVAALWVQALGRLTSPVRFPAPFQP